jgi:adenylate cyclase
MAAFDEVGRALDCGAAIQDGFDGRNAADAGPPLRFRIGFAAGEPVDRGETCSALPVTLASRIRDAATGGQVLVSEVVRDLGTDAGHRFAGVGDRALKGFDEPVVLFEYERDQHNL